MMHEVLDVNLIVISSIDFDVLAFNVMPGVNNEGLLHVSRVITDI